MIRLDRLCLMLVFALSGLHSVVCTAGPREDLTQLLRETYPQHWSGRIAWYYTPERDVVSDLHDANVRKHDVVYFDSETLKYVRGSFDFDGSEQVSIVYDGDLFVAFSPSGLPGLAYPDFNSLGRESAILAYIFLAQPGAYVVEESDEQFVAHDVAGFEVFFDSSSGEVNSVRIGEFAWYFDEYVTVNGCPWATRCRFVLNGDENGNANFAYARVEYRKLKSQFFDYARFYKKSSYGSEGKRIVFLGSQEILAEDARAREWPATRMEWDEMMMQLIESQDLGKAPSRGRSSPGSSSSFHFSYRALIWVGIFLAGTGLVGIILVKVRK